MKYTMVVLIHHLSSMLQLRVLFLLGIALSIAGCSGSRRSATNNVAKPDSPTNWQKQYSEALGFDVTPIKNKMLVEELAAWMGVGYKYGGNSKEGTDCSGLISQVFPVVYKQVVPRSSLALYQASSEIKEKELKEGDLVFFKINTKQVGHAGLYLCEGNFAHATTTKGVVISNLNDAYWKKYFVAAGRILKENNLSKN